MQMDWAAFFFLVFVFASPFLNLLPLEDMLTIKKRKKEGRKDGSKERKKERMKNNRYCLASSDIHWLPFSVGYNLQSITTVEFYTMFFET